MTTKSMKAADNPDMANSLINQVISASDEHEQEASISYPSEVIVTLPIGHINPLGEVVTEAEVRELNGRDEEALARFNTSGKMFSTILERAVVRVGNEPATTDLLDKLLTGDRDALLLGIYKATFGPTTEVDAFCNGCSIYKTLEVNVDEDIPIKELKLQEDRRFEVKGKKAVYTVVLPNGKTQKELYENADKSMAELNTILLEGTVREINGKSVMTKAQVQEIGLSDRRAIVTALNSRIPGPQFTEIKVDCPDCGGEVVAPISLGLLFRL